MWLSVMSSSNLAGRCPKSYETQQSAAREAAPVEEEQLTAQTWFERGYVFAVEAKNFDEALRCFSKSILLDPNLADTQNNLANTLKKIKAI